MALFIIAKDGSVELSEEELPPLQNHYVRGRTLATGISHGTELHVLRGQDTGTSPRKLGYSAVGEVTEVGSAVQTIRTGDVIFAYAPHGSEFQVPENSCYRLPEELPPERGQFLALLGVAYNGIMEARITLGETVAVFGLGVVGQLVCQLARRSGARKVIGIDPIEMRRKIAHTIEVDGVIDPREGDLREAFHALNEGMDADVVIETSGAIGGLNGAIKVIREQCDIIVLSWYPKSAEGLDLERDFHFKRPKIRMAQGHSIHPELSPRWTHERRIRVGAEMLPSLHLEELITHRMGIGQAKEAYRLLKEHPEQIIQIVFTYR